MIHTTNNGSIQSLIDIFSVLSVYRFMDFGATATCVMVS